MIITMIESLLVFFMFGSKWFFNFLATSVVYITSKDKRYHAAVLLLLLYLNFWIFGNLVDLFNDFNIMVLIRILATEGIMYGLSYLMVLFMSFFSTSETGFISYPGAFIFGIITVPAIELIMTVIYNLIGFIIVV